VTEQTELKRLAFNHAQIISETGSEMRALAERPDLVASATRVLEKRLRDLANSMEPALCSMPWQQNILILIFLKPGVCLDSNVTSPARPTKQN
jgi:hypothetical protein